MSDRPRRLTAIVLATTGLTLGLLVSAPAFAAAPAAPVGLGTSQPNSSTPILAWDLVEGAAKYEVQIDDDPGRAGPAGCRGQRVGQRRADTHVEVADQAHPLDAVVRRRREDLIVGIAHNRSF